MIILKSFPNFHIAFHVTSDGRLNLIHLGRQPMTDDAVKNETKWHNAVDIHVAGKNQDDHHGAKHTGSSSLDTLKYVSDRTVVTEDGECLEFLLRDDEMEVTLHYQLYNGISAVRSWTTVRNISDKAVGLEYVSSFSMMGIEENTPDENIRVMIPHNYWTREVNWKSYTLSELGLNRAENFSMKRIAYSNTGTWSTKEYLPMGAFAREDSLLLWQIEQNGSWHWEISDLAKRLYLKLSGPTERENGWYRELKPGESFESVKAAVVVGADFSDAIKEMTRYRRRIAKKVEADQKLPVIFNDYMNCLLADPTTEKELPVIDRAAEAGAEYYVVDAGWYADGTWWETVGEWQPCGWRFPNGGLKVVFEYIRSKGMIPGIWLEIEVMGIHCPILDQFEDDCFFMRHGKRVIDHGRYQLNFANKKVRDFATSVIDRVIRDYGVGYIKMDYNIDGGIGVETKADSFGDGLLRHNRAYLAWIDDISEKYPDVIIENCSSGGMRLDYAMLSHHPIQSMTDQEDCTEMTHIAQAAATAALPEQAAIWAYPVAKDSENKVALNMVNAMMLRLHLSGQIMDLDEKQFAIVQEGVACYKQIRGEIRDAIPFYPLGMPRYEERMFCAGYAGKGKTFLLVWRLEGSQSILRIPIDGRNAHVLYPSGNRSELSGGEEVLEVTLPEENTAVLIEL